jgi:hypothetical protein
MISVNRPYIKGYIIKVARTEPKAKIPPKPSGKRTDKEEAPMTRQGRISRAVFDLMRFIA